MRADSSNDDLTSSLLKSAEVIRLFGGKQSKQRYLSYSKCFCGLHTHRDEEMWRVVLPLEIARTGFVRLEMAGSIYIYTYVFFQPPNLSDLVPFSLHSYG